MEDRQKSRRLFGCRRIDFPDAAIRDRALESNRMHNTFYLMISRLRGTTRNL